MTTYTTTGSYANGSDAQFQAWALSVHAAMIGMGLVQTSDTGQGDWSTLARPAANTLVAGRMYRFDDPLQASAPIFIRIEPGTGNALANYGMRITVGIATDGANNMSGSYQVNTGAITALGSTYTGTNDTWGCHVPGCAWLVWNYENSTAGPAFSFFVARTCDDTGAPTAEGAVCYFKAGASSGTVSLLRFESPAAVIVNNGNNTPAAFIPFGLTTSAVGVDKQMYPHWTSTPRTRQNPFVFSFMTSEWAHGIAIAAIEPYAGLPGTYLPIAGPVFGTNAVAIASTSGHGYGLIWE